ncbi:MAG: hypothetical protein ABSG68_08640, partial [Thermoguttaceae bacterium]
MRQYVISREKTLPASGNTQLDIYKRVRMDPSSKVLLLCGTTDLDSIGNMNRPMNTGSILNPSSGSVYCPVTLLSSQGTMVGVADGVIPAGLIYAGANGKVSAAGTVCVGVTWD